MNNATLSVKEDSFEYALLFTVAVVAATLQTIASNVAQMLKGLRKETVTVTPAPAPLLATETTHQEIETMTISERHTANASASLRLATGYTETGMRIVYEVDDSSNHTPTLPAPAVEPICTPSNTATLRDLFQAVAAYPDYGSMNIRQLKAHASGKVKGYGDMKKHQLINALHSYHRHASSIC